MKKPLTINTKPVRGLNRRNAAVLDILTAQLCEEKEMGMNTRETIRKINRVINTKPIK